MEIIVLAVHDLNINDDQSRVKNYVENLKVNADFFIH
jgi:hypothetical protein